MKGILSLSSDVGSAVLGSLFFFLKDILGLNFDVELLKLTGVVGFGNFMEFVGDVGRLGEVGRRREGSRWVGEDGR